MYNVLLVSIIVLLVIGVSSIIISYLTGALKPDPTPILKQDEADELQREALKIRLKESAKRHKNSVRITTMSTPRRITAHSTPSNSFFDSEDTPAPSYKSTWEDNSPDTTVETNTFGGFGGGSFGGGGASSSWEDSSSSSSSSDSDSSYSDSSSDSGSSDSSSSSSD